MNDQEKDDLKDVEFYSAAVAGWINTKLEKDKSILTISSAGIGLLVTLLTTKGSTGSIESIFYCLAFLGFVVAIIIAIYIFGKNAEVLEAAASDAHVELKWVDLTFVASFILGITATVGVGVTHGLVQPNPQPKSEATQQSAIPTGNVTPQLGIKRKE